MGLPLINSGVYAQVVTPMYGARQITSGTVQGVKIMWCHEDGRENIAGSWGHLESLDQLDLPLTLLSTAPKYQALLDRNKSFRRLFRNVRLHTEAEQ